MNLYCKFYYQSRTWRSWPLDRRLDETCADETANAVLAARLNAEVAPNRSFRFTLMHFLKYPLDEGSVESAQRAILTIINSAFRQHEDSEVVVDISDRVAQRRLEKYRWRPDDDAWAKLDGFCRLLFEEKARGKNPIGVMTASTAPAESTHRLRGLFP